MLDLVKVSVKRNWDFRLFHADCGCLNYRGVDYAESCTYDVNRRMGVCTGCKNKTQGDKCDECMANYFQNPAATNASLAYPDGSQCVGKLFGTCLTLFHAFLAFNCPDWNHTALGCYHLVLIQEGFGSVNSSVEKGLKTQSVLFILQVMMEPRWI